MLKCYLLLFSEQAYGFHASWPNKDNKYSCTFLSCPDWAAGEGLGKPVGFQLTFVSFHDIRVLVESEGPSALELWHTRFSYTRRFLFIHPTPF